MFDNCARRPRRPGAIPGRQTRKTAMPKIPPPETVARVRRAYVDGMPVGTICTECGVTRDTLYACTDGRHPDGSGSEPAPIPRRRAGRRRRSREDTRADLVDRLWRTAERQVDEIDKRLEAAGLEPAEGEGNARTLAIVVKTLRDLSALDAAGKAPGRGPGQEAANDDDDAVPRNIDDLRRELARKLEAFVAGEQDPVSGDA